jgi:tetratricopeptide (TPR) repeat protein
LAAATWQRNQTYRSAEALWQDVIAKRPQHARAYTNLGVALLRQGQPERAAPVLEEALRRDPLDSAAHNARADLLAAQGRLTEAIADYRLAVQLAPALAPRILYNMANALAQQGHYEEATRRYAAVLRLQPAFADAQNNWGNVLMVQGRRDEAARHYQAALAIEPRHPHASRNLALARLPPGAAAPSRRP